MRATSFLLAAMLVFSLAGCGPKGPGSNFHPQYYPECYDPIARLCQDRDKTERAKATGFGALTGAVGGALIGLLATGDARGAAAGAVAGAVAGGITGYIYQSVREIKDQERRLQEFQRVLGEEGRNLDLQHASVLKSFRCYQEQINIVKARYKSGSMSREEARARFDEIHKGLDILKAYWDERGQEFDANAAQADNFIQEQDRLAQRSAERARVARAREMARANQAKKIRMNDEVNNAYNRASQDIQEAMA